MKRVSISLIYVVVVLFATSCMGTAYYEAYPSPTASLDIAPEGDTLRLKLVEWEWSHTTRFEPGVMPKHYRYRIVEDGVTGAESEDQTYESDVSLRCQPYWCNKAVSHRREDCRGLPRRSARLPTLRQVWQLADCIQS